MRIKCDACATAATIETRGQGTIQDSETMAST